MYRALVAFNDLKDNNRSYDAGEIFPRNGLNVTEARYKELSTNANKSGFPLIEYIPDEKPVKKTRRKVKADA